jgi:hypothetical protein
MGSSPVSAISSLARRSASDPRVDASRAREDGDHTGSLSLSLTAHSSSSIQDATQRRSLTLDTREEEKSAKAIRLAASVGAEVGDAEEDEPEHE